MTNDDYILEHPYVNEDPEIISLLESVEQEQPIRWIGQDRAVIKISKESPLHWSEREALGYKPNTREEYELGDQLADHSDDQGYDE